MRIVTVVFRHSRVERTSAARWMCVYFTGPRNDTLRHYKVFTDT
jgi:hypothetical protein